MGQLPIAIKKKKKTHTGGYKSEKKKKKVFKMNFQHTSGKVGVADLIPKRCSHTMALHMDIVGI